MRKRSEEITLRIRVEVPTGINAKMVMDHVRWSLSNEALCDENRDAQTVKMAELEYRVSLSQRVTNYA